LSGADDDRELVRRANAGDPRALDELYRRHRDWVVGLAYRFTGDHDDALDVRSILRTDGDRTRLQEILLQAIGEKPLGHELHHGLSNDRLSMYQVGG